jgi:PAS domain S-box-containing protein
MLPKGRNGQPSHPSGQSTLDALTHRHGEQLKALAAASVRIAAATSPDATLQQITEEARGVVGAHLAATHRVSHTNWNGASVAVSLSEKYGRFASFSIPPNGRGIYRRAIHAGQPLRLSASELTAHPDWRGLSGYKPDHPPLRGLVAVPITNRDGTSVGVIMLSDKDDGDFTPEDEAILIQLAQIASVSIENALATHALRESETRLRATQEHANIAIGEVDDAGRFIAVNGGFATITGYSRDELLNRTLFDLTHPDDTPVERELYARHMRGDLKHYALEKRYVRKDGTSAWVAVSASGVFNEAGKFLYGVRVVQDIDQRKRTEERQQLLIRELHHRVRNTLANVQAMLGATARSASSIQAFYDSFAARIAALGRTHTLLTDDYWQTAPLREMLRHELAPYDDGTEGRITLEGPPVELAADLAVPTGMAIHELSANAAKHGALSTQAGRLFVRWDIVEEGGTRKLSLEWIESGGPPPQEPTKTGFGSTLLQRVLSVQCKADVELRFDQSGLHFRMVAPLVEQRLVPSY